MKTDKSGIMRIPPKGKIDFGEMLLREQLFKKGIDPKMIKNEKQLDNIINTPVVPKSERVKPKKSGKVIEVDFDKNKNWFKGKSEGTKSLFATDKEFADELRSLRLNIIKNNPQFNLEIAENYKLPGGKTYAPYPDKEPGKLLSPTQRQKMLDEIKNIMKHDEYRSQFGRDFNFEEITDEMFRIKKAGGGKAKESWTDKLVRWAGGPSMVAGELGIEGLNQIYQLLNMPGLYNKGGRAGIGYLLAEDTNERVPLKDGHSPGRRKFLKIMGGLAALPVVGKLFKFAKPAAKVADVTSVPIKSGVDGMPSWFKPLVNKVIKEGTEIPSGAERVIVHKTKLPNSKTDVYVEQDLNTGDVVVDIGMGKHGWADGHYGQPARLHYKAKEIIEPDIDDAGKVKSKGQEIPEEFNVEEAEFTGGHPENVKFEESVVEKYGDHGSDFSEVERFATGKNVIKDKSGKFKEVETLPTTKKADQLEWARGRAEAEADAAADMADDYASGGIARMLGE